MTEQPASSLTRRKFLGLAVAGATTMVAAQWVTTHIAPCQAEGNDTAESWGMLIDLTRCVGCGSCALACKARNNLPTNSPPTELNSDTFTFVDQRQATTSTGESVTRYVKRQCMHCLDASCVSACPAGAMHKSAEGPVVYNASRCLGCRYCQMACPFDVPAFAWDNGLTPTISKCWLCYEAVSEGGRPACASACPTGALRFGNRSDLLAQAHALIASNPGRYVATSSASLKSAARRCCMCLMCRLTNWAFRPICRPPHPRRKQKRLWALCRTSSAA